MDEQEELKKLFLNFQKNNWMKLCPVEKRIEVLDQLVNLYSRQFGVSKLCGIKLVDCLPDHVNAQYNPTTNNIELRQEMVEFGYIKEHDGNIKHLPNVENFILFYFAHELKHAEQDYYLQTS
jgi:hypothetical protein